MRTFRAFVCCDRKLSRAADSTVGRIRVRGAVFELSTNKEDAVFKAGENWIMQFCLVVKESPFVSLSIS